MRLRARRHNKIAAAFDSRRLSTLVGLLVIVIGSISAATVANGFAGYASEIKRLFETIQLMGLTPAEYNAAAAMLLSEITPSGMTVEQVRAQIEGR